MNRILYYILVLIIVGLPSGFMFKASFSFPETIDTWATITEEKKWYSVILGPTVDSPIEYRDIDIKNTTLIKDNAIIYGEFGRLSSIMYLYQTGAEFPPIIMSGSTGAILSDIQGIVSLYDLFTTYTIFAQSGEYKIEQVTNGSFYIGKEKSGKIAIYAIDGVIRLYFLSEGKEMTSMLLFPGSYIRFDPSRNSELNGTDLFRTILSLDTQENEIFEFVNPRVNSGDESDTFFNYRLPIETKYLFRVLTRKFHTQIEQVDLLKEYGSDYSYKSNESIEGLYNPSKKNFFMLLELKQLLSQVVKGQDNSDSLVRRISLLYNTSKDLNLGRDARRNTLSAKETIEKFLLDGRFALYGNVGDVGKGYQDTYEKIAKMIGIEPTKGKSKLLQNLSDIYSANLFLQARKTATFRIDTFEPTATSLRVTLREQGIENKDYFDIAIYAFNILEKIQEKGLFSLDYLENKSTYDYLVTFFYAGSRYMDSIEDVNKKNDIVQGFATKFYERILTMIVNSLYASTMYNDEGYLYVKKELVEGTEIQLDIKMMDYIGELYGVISGVNQTVISAFDASDSGTGTYADIQRATLRLSGLVDIFDKQTYKEAYKAYIDAPYIVDESETIPLPKVNNTLDELLTREPGQESLDILSIVDPRIDKVMQIFPNAATGSFSLDDDFVRVNNAFSPIIKGDKSEGEGYWTMLFISENSISQVGLKYGGRDIRIILPQTITLDQFNTLRNTTLGPYIDIIESNSDISGEVRIYTHLKRVDIGTTIFNL